MIMDHVILAELEKRIKSNGRSIRVIVQDYALQLGRTERHIYRLLKKARIYNSGKKNPAHKGTWRCGITDLELKRIIKRKAGGFKAGKIGEKTIRVDPLTKKNQCATWQAIEELYAAGLINQLYKEATINRLIRERGASLRQQRQDKPFVDRISKHPNHVWEYDTTWCAQVYLDSGEFYLVDTEKELYRNKPALNIKGKKLIRYVIVDHYSSLFYVQYYLNEDAVSFQDFFWKACRPKNIPQLPLRGVPFILITDQTKQVSDSISQKYLERLEVKHLTHFPENARAKGSVETTMAFWERVFESRLRFQPAMSIEEINKWADARCAQIATQRIMGRAGKPRAVAYNQFLKREHIREMPDYELYRQLAHKEKECMVYNNGVIKYKGCQYRIGTKYAGQKVPVQWSPYDSQNVQIKLENGKVLLLPPIELDEVGRRTDHAGIIGETYVSNKDNTTIKTLKQAAKVELKDFRPFDQDTTDGVKFLPVKGKEYKIEATERFLQWETAEQVIYQNLGRAFTDEERTRLDQLKVGQENGMMSEAMLKNVIEEFQKSYREKIWQGQTG